MYKALKNAFCLATLLLKNQLTTEKRVTHSNEKSLETVLGVIMASSEVSEVFTSSFEDERTLNQLANDNVNDDLYGSEELIVSSEDVPQSEEIVGSSIADTLNDVYVPTTPELNPGVDLIKKEPGLCKPKMRSKKSFHKNGLESLFHSAADIDKETTWQQKRVSIKTLEGEFSVTMWASGTEDGKRTL